jgi:hypothetical protein
MYVPAFTVIAIKGMAGLKIELFGNSYVAHKILLIGKGRDSLK